MSKTYARNGKIKRLTIRMPESEWKLIRSLFDSRVFTDNNAAVYAMNGYASLNPKKLP